MGWPILKEGEREQERNIVRDDYLMRTTGYIKVVFVIPLLDSILPKGIPIVSRKHCVVVG